MYNKADLKNVIVGAGNKLRTARMAVRSLTPADLALFCDQSPAPQEAITIAGALCILLGVKPNWRYMCKLLKEGGSRDFLATLKPYSLADEVVAVAARVLHAQRAVTQAQVAQSPLDATRALYAWLTVMTDDNVEQSIRRKRASVWASMAPALS